MQVKSRYRYWRMRRIKDPKQRLYSGLILAGVSILLFRTLRMVLVEQAFEILVEWVYTLLILEFMIDLACLLAALRWFVLSKWKYASSAMKLGAWAAILHAIRVAIYVLGRTGPWENFDVQPRYHTSYTFDWFWIYFAAGFSILSLVGLYVTWRLWRQYKSKYSRLFEQS